MARNGDEPISSPRLALLPDGGPGCARLPFRVIYVLFIVPATIGEQKLSGETVPYSLPQARRALKVTNNFDQSHSSTVDDTWITRSWFPQISLDRSASLRLSGQCIYPSERFLEARLSDHVRGRGVQDDRDSR